MEDDDETKDEETVKDEEKIEEVADLTLEDGADENNAIDLDL